MCTLKLNKTYITISRARVLLRLSVCKRHTFRRTSSSRIYPPLDHTRGCRSAKKDIGKTYRPILQFAVTSLISFLIAGHTSSFRQTVLWFVFFLFCFIYFFLFLLFHLNKKVGTGFSVGRRFPTCH